MAFENHVRRGHPITFGLLTFFALIEGSLTGYLVSTYNSHDNYPSASVRDRVRFLLFTSWWTFIFSALYLAFYLTDMVPFITSIASHGIWLALTWLFWLAGAAAFSASVGGGLNCGGSGIIHCNQLAATEAFAWIEWIIMTFALVVVVFIGARAWRSGNRFSGGLTD